MSTSAAYPTRQLGAFLQPVSALRQGRLALSGFSQRRAVLRELRNHTSNDMTLISSPSRSEHKTKDTPIAVVVARNERHLLPAFLHHYRQLGVNHFAIVDDASSDDTGPYLAAQPDVDLWTSPLRYAEAGRGRFWREHLFSHYGRDRWYLIVDTDEFLIFDGSDRGIDLPAVIANLERHRIFRMAAPMIDAYPKGPLASATFDGTERIMPWQIATYVDASGYTLRRGKTALELLGGVRRRLFDSGAELMKYPLMRVDDACGIGISIHRPIASPQNFAGIFGILLHFKLFGDTLARASVAVADQQYYRGAREYQKFLDRRAIFETTAIFEGSMRIGETREFVEKGFFLPLPD